MRRFHDDGDAQRIDLLPNRIRDLAREPLLDLQTPAEDIDQPRNLAQADYLGPWNIGDVTLAEERQEVMLTETVEVDVLDDDHLAVVDREQRVVEDCVDVHVVAARQKLEGLLDAFGSVQQSLAARIFTDLGKELPDERLH
jgi:hypothetical protein